MSTICRGRYTARSTGSFVVSIIGMRANPPWALHKWLPLARAMGPMVGHLLNHREPGLLHALSCRCWRAAPLDRSAMTPLLRIGRDPRWRLSSGQPGLPTIFKSAGALTC